MTESLSREREIVRQRPVSLPSTLADFLVAAASSCHVSPSDLLVQIVNRELSSTAEKPFDLDKFNRSRMASDPPVKLLTRFPVKIKKKLQEAADKFGKTPNLLIFQSLLDEFGKQGKDLHSCST